MSRVRELQQSDIDKPSLKDQESRDDVRAGVDSTGVVPKTSPITEPRKKFNTIHLGVGEHGGAVLSKDNTHIQGIAGAIVTRKVNIEADARVTSVHFKSNGNNKDYLVRLSNTASVIFNNCTFEKSTTDPQSTTFTDEQAFVLVHSASKAVFSACLFTGSVSGDYVIFNEDNANNEDVQVVGCINKTGVAHNKVKIIGGLT